MPEPVTAQGHGESSEGHVSLRTTLLRASQLPLLPGVLGEGLSPLEIVGSLGSPVAHAGPVASFLEVRLLPGRETSPLPAQGNESILMVLEGTLSHHDLGRGSTDRLQAGDVLRLRDGPGAERKESNEGDVPAHFLQISLPLRSPSAARKDLVRAAQVPTRSFPGGISFRCLAGEGSPLDLGYPDLTLERWSLDPETVVAYAMEPGEGLLLWAEAGRFTLDSPGPPRLGPFGIATGDSLLVESAARERVRLLSHAPDAGRDRSPGHYLLARFNVTRHQMDEGTSSSVLTHAPRPTSAG